MSIRNIKRSTQPIEIYRSVNNQKTRIKRVYKVISDEPIIVWDVGGDISLTYTTYSDGYTVEYLQIANCVGTIDWGDGTTSAYDENNPCHLYEKAGEYTATLSTNSDISEIIAFNDANHIAKIYLPKSVKKIPDYFLAWSETLKDAVFVGVTEIPYMCFCYCTNLEKLNIPDSVQSICAYAFYSAESLKEINFSSNSKLKNLDNSCFYYNNALEKIALPKNPITLNHYSSYFDEDGDCNNTMLFVECQNLKNCNLGGLTDFFFDTFYNCYGIQDIYINGNIENIDMYSSIFMYNAGKSPSNINLHFDGTLERWTNVTKISHLQFGLTVICTDGTVVYQAGDGWNNSKHLAPDYSAH